MDLNQPPPPNKPWYDRGLTDVSLVGSRYVFAANTSYDAISYSVPSTAKCFCMGAHFWLEPAATGSENVTIKMSSVSPYSDGTDYATFRDTIAMVNGVYQHIPYSPPHFLLSSDDDLILVFARFGADVVDYTVHYNVRLYQFDA